MSRVALLLLLLAAAARGAKCPTVNLNVRATPGGSVRWVSSPGDVFEVLLVRGDWMQVKRCGGTAAEGWISTISR